MSDNGQTTRPRLTPVEGGAAPSTSSAAKQKPKEERKQPTKRLPTDRIKFKSQLEIIRAYGNASQGGTRAINYKEVAKQMKMDPDSVTLMSVFLVENGFADRVGNDLMPSKPVVDFALAHTWSAETAPKKLASLVKKTWFGQFICTALGFRAQTENEIVAELAHEISAGPEFKPRIELLIDYAEAVGLIRRENNQLMLAESITESTPQKLESMASAQSPPPDNQPKNVTSSTTTGFATTEGVVQFHVSIRVTMAEMAGWSPDRITAFFGGLAKVLAAKKGTEIIE